MPILNEQELLEDTAELILNYTDKVTYEQALNWLRNNGWFMNDMMSDMWEAQSNFVADNLKCIIKDDL